MKLLKKTFPAEAHSHIPCCHDNNTETESGSKSSNLFFSVFFRFFFVSITKQRYQETFTKEISFSFIVSDPESQP